MNYYMNYLENIFEQYNFEILSALIITSFLLLIFNTVNRTKVAVMAKKYKQLIKLLQVEKSESLEHTICNYIEELSCIKEIVTDLEFKNKEINDKLNLTIQKVGFIRYSAFNDMGSDLSFSIAMLDENLDGFVITNIYAKDESNVYAKPIKNGESTYPLSVEEVQAIDRAKKISVEAKV